VAAVEIVDPLRVRFRLKQPWPDFLTFYSSTTGAGWIVLSSGTGRDGHFLRIEASNESCSLSIRNLFRRRLATNAADL